MALKPPVPAIHSRRVGRRSRARTLACGVELAELLGFEQVLGSVSLLLHVGELALHPSRSWTTSCTARRSAFGDKTGVPSARAISVRTSAPITSSPLPIFFHSAASARARSGVTRQRFTMSRSPTPWSSSSNASAAASPSGGALGARAARARWISSGSKK
jgi:hypothetical protein